MFFAGTVMISYYGAVHFFYFFLFGFYTIRLHSKQDASQTPEARKN